MRQQLLDGNIREGKNAALIYYGMYSSYIVPFAYRSGSTRAANPPEKGRASSVFLRVQEEILFITRYVRATVRATARASFASVIEYGWVKKKRRCMRLCDVGVRMRA